MLRSGLLWLSRRHTLFRLAQRNGLARAFARRFVAGETLDDALAAVRAVNARGLTASLDLLGESVGSSPEAHRARDEIITVLDRIAATGVRSNVSVKLTQLGLDVDVGLATGRWPCSPLTCIQGSAMGSAWSSRAACADPKLTWRDSCLTGPASGWSRGPTPSRRTWRTGTSVMWTVPSPG